MDSALLSALKKRIAEDFATVSGDILSGRMRTFDEYRYQCGVLFGANTVLKAAEDILREIEKGK